MLRILFLACLTALLTATAHAATVPVEQPFLFQQEPFDEITLDQANGHTRLRVARLAPAARAPNPGRKGKLQLKLLEEPETSYEIAWKHIEKITPFEELVLAEAQGMLRKGQFDIAFHELTFLKDAYPDTPSLEETIEAYLIASAGASYRAKNYDEAFAQLLELHKRNPLRKELPRAMDRTIDRLLDRAVRTKAYANARALLDIAQTRLSELNLPASAAWGQKLIERATVELQSARDHDSSKDYEAAREACRRALGIWPALDEATSLLHKLQQTHPAVVVGVIATAGPQPNHRIDAWAARRVSHLLSPTLVELIGYNDEGPVYGCPYGRFQRNATGTEMVVVLREDLHLPGSDQVLTGYDVSKNLVAAFADPRVSPMVNAARGLRSIRVESVFRVTITLARPLVRPESLVEVALAGQFETVSPANGPLRGLGPYRVERRRKGETRYVFNEGSYTAHPGQPLRIIERSYQDEDSAVDALQRAEIDVVDRVPPWRIKSLQRDPQLTLGRYALPTVHLLIPNVNRPRMDERSLCRGICYAIHRRAIVDQVLLRGEHLPGFSVLSGPFPIGLSLDDPLGAATDRRIAPRPYEPRLSVVLMDTALRDVMLRGDAGPPTSTTEAAAGAEDDTSTARPADSSEAEPLQLTLAHPPGSVIRLSCEAIREHLKMVGVAVQLQEIPASAPRSAFEQVDLVYAELALWEPIADSHRLFGDGGLVGSPSPYMQWALRQLREARSWTEARKRLWEVHRIAHAESRIIPLWQTPNFFGYRATWQGLDDQSVELYQHVTQWRDTLASKNVAGRQISAQRRTALASHTDPLRLLPQAK
ncbi:MAG: ABC transporter substrate-binding protein [Pirellulales bacterium]